MKLILVIGGLCAAAIISLFIMYADWNYLRLRLSDITMPLRHGIYRDRSIMVPMRDGVELSMEVHRPLSGKGPYPAILIRTTYGATDFSLNKFFVKNGYVVVVQHVRGRYRSQGDSYSPHSYSRSDGYDTIEWIVQQRWSSGKVGTFGCSYQGEAQIILAAANHPNHIAMIADGAGGAIGKAKKSYGYFGVFENGVLNLASALGWFTAEGAIYYKKTPRPDDYEMKMAMEMEGLPVSELAGRIVPYKTGFDEIVSRSLTDSWWDEEGYITEYDTFSAATLHVNTWYDQTVHDTFRLAAHMSERAVHPRAKSQHLLIDPGIHCGAGKLEKGPVQVGEMIFHYEDPDFFQIYLDWFDYWLKVKERSLPSRFQYFLIHGSRWETSRQWPPEKTEFRRFYFQKEGALGLDTQELTPENGETFDGYVYDPLDPVPTIGGPICCTYRDVDIPGAIDQGYLKTRDDVLIYTSEKLESNLDLIGNAKATLYVSTSALDTDFTVKIVDQYPDGKAYNLQDGVVRLRYREGIDNPRLANPEEIYRVELELRPIAYRFRAGHRISVYVSSSNFPRLARNLNSGNAEYQDDVIVKASNSVYRVDPYASYIELPIAAQ